MNNKETPKHRSTVLEPEEIPTEEDYKDLTDCCPPSTTTDSQGRPYPVKETKSPW